MQVTFYNTSDNINKINKTLNSGVILDCNIINNTNILNVSLISNSDTLNYNYCYINDLHRYYFITNTVLDNNRIIHDCKIDVMYTYRNQILNSEQFINRVEDHKFSDIPDSLVAFDEKPVIITKKLYENLFENIIPQYILTTT